MDNQSNDLQEKKYILPYLLKLHREESGWNYLEFFVLKENSAIMFESLKMYPEALQKYDELRNRYHECTLISPEKLSIYSFFIF